MEIVDKNIIERTEYFRSLSEGFRDFLKELHSLKAKGFDPNTERDTNAFKEIYACVIQQLAEMRMNHRELYIVIP
jgi:hypothetical protein